MKRANVIMALFLAMQATGCTPADSPRIYIVDATVLPGESGSGLWRPWHSQATAAVEALRAYLDEKASSAVNPWERPEERDYIRKYLNSYSLQIEGVRKPPSNRFYGVEGNGPKQIHIDGF